MKKISLALLTLSLVAGSYGQATKTAVATRPLKKVATLPMPGENGANGASVAWHPVLKKYYTSMAGNATFNFAVFDATFKRISADDLEAMVDLRGLWYNTISKKIEGNGYADYGWISYNLNAKGIPEEFVQLQEGQVQPEEQSLGVFDAVKKRVCFLSGARIIQYDLKGNALDETIDLKLGGKDMPDEGELIDEDEEDVAESYNSVMCYTGILNSEFAVLNTVDMQIETYNRKGDLTKKLKLPSDYPLDKVYGSFNFSYANGIWWLFDKEERMWVGYK